MPSNRQVIKVLKKIQHLRCASSWAWLNVFVRQSAHLGMCNIAQSVNVISPLLISDKGIIKQTAYWPLLLFSRYMHGKALGVGVRCQKWTGNRTNPE
jgi:alpha-N-arabinofuranosidase